MESDITSMLELLSDMKSFDENILPMKFAPSENDSDELFEDDLEYVAAAQKGFADFYRRLKNE